jgi:hypothetical protein
MNYAEAIEIGKVCGLESAPEAINNVLIHAEMLFERNNMTNEINELFIDSKKNGIKFCQNCNMALLDNECYMERNLNQTE